MANRKRNPRERYALNNIQAGSQRYNEDLLEYNDYYGPTLTYLRNNPEENIDLDRGNTQRTVFDNYEDAPTLDSEKGFLTKSLEFFGDVGSDIVNSNRTWAGKLVDQFIDGADADIRDAYEEQSDIEKIQKYKELQLRLRDLKTKPQFDSRGWRITPEQQQEEIRKTEEEISKLDDYFMGEGRSHTVIAQQMFDTNKMDLFDKGYVNALYTGRKDLNPSDYLDGSISGVGNYLAASLLNIPSRAVGVAEWLIDTGAQGIANLIGDGDKVNGYKTGEVIKSIDTRNESQKRLLEKLYKGSAYNIADINQSIDDNKLNDWKEYNDRRIAEYTADKKSYQQFAKTGVLHLPFFDVDIYDPEKIPQQFKEAQQLFGEHWYDYFIHPYDAFIYGVPETASTVGLFSNQLKAMGVNGVLNYLAHEAPTWAVGGGGKLASKVPAWLRTFTGKMLSKDASLAAMQAAGVGAGINAAVESRKKETSLEAIQAVTERVSNDVVNKGGDIEKITSAVLDKAERLGFDTSDFGIDDIIKFGVAYNVETGDPVFDASKEEAKKGLNKLINANNALAFVDYCQALPFMSYSAKAFKDWANAAQDKVFKLFGAPSPKMYVNSAIAQQSKPLMQSINDAVVGRITKRFFKDRANIGKGFFAKHTGEWIMKKIPLVAGESFSEGLEEANQDILQSRYKRGLYDDYNKTPNMLDVNEVFGDANLSFEALAAYVGIHPHDPELNVEELRKAFHIGAFSSGIFSGLLHGASNFVHSDSENIRNLLAQLKNDKYISNIIANYYDQVQDQTHLELFFDAFSKAGVNNERLVKALNDLKDGVDENNTLVKKDYLDSDIQLVNAAWAMYNNDNINDALKANGIEKYGDVHKQIVVEGAARIVEELKNEEQIREQEGDIRNRLLDHISVATEMLDENTSEERLKQLELEYPKLAKTVLGLRNDYLDYKSHRENSKRGKFGAFSKSFDSLKKFLENEGVRDYIIKRGLSEETVAKENNEDYNPLEEEARRIWLTPKERKAALRYAYEYENKKTYRDALQDKNKFFRNKYIRQYARDRVSSETFIKSKLEELYSDKEKRNEAINAAYEAYDNGTYSLKDYVIERLHLLHNAKRLQRLLYARDVAADKHKRNTEVRRHTGLDTYTGLEGILKSLDAEIEHYKKVEKKQLGGITWDSLFKGKNYEFDDQQEYDLTFSSLLLNKALLGPLRMVAAAYLMGYAKPQSLRDAVFGEKGVNNTLDSLVDDYSDILAQENINQESEAKVLTKSQRAALQVDKLNISKKAAWEIIKTFLDEKIKRTRIANRIFLEEGPVTQETAEAAQAQIDQSSQQNEEKSVAETPGVQEMSESDAEKRLKEKYNHEKKDKKSLKERIEERRKARRAAEVEDDVEPEEQNAEDETFGEDLGEDSAVDEALIPEDNNDSEKKPAAEEKKKTQPETKKEVDDEDTVDEDAGDVDEAGDNTKTPDTKDVDIDYEDSKTGDGTDIDYEDNDTDSDVDIDYGDNKDENIDISEEDYKNEDDETTATVLENGWVLIDDYSGLEINDEGFLMYDGEILPPEQEQAVKDDIILLGLSEQLDFDQDELPEGKPITGKDERLVATNDLLTDLISQTFFYQPNPKVNEETGEDELPKLTVNDKEVLFDKPLASGRKLSEKLSKRGWLKSTKKYFVVAQSQLGRNVAKDKDIRDAMTIALVIEDDTNTYLTFLRPLGLTESEGYGPHGSIMVNSETARRNWLLSRHVDWRSVLSVIDDPLYSYSNGQITKKGSKYPLTSSLKVALYKQAVAKTAMERGRQQYFANYGTYDGFEHWWTNDPIRSDFKTDDAWNKAVSERKRTRKLLTDRARQSLAHAGKHILSDEQVDEQITKLREYRNQIIDAYLTKETKNGKILYKFPSTIRKSVTPAKVLQSNGKINSKKDAFKNPIYRTIGKENESIEELQKDLETGKITLGYGLGMFANENDRFAIRGLLESLASTTFNGRGLSGKIYMMVDGPAGADAKIPIMLSEELFNTQVLVVDGKLRTVWLNNPNNLVMCLKKNLQTGEFENVNTEGYQPSAAEIIFYMLINQMSIGLDAERHAEMVEFFIHSGEKTLLKNLPKSGSDPFNVLGRKQLAFHTVNDKQVLTIGINNGNGMYVARDYTVEEMMAQTPEGEDLRRLIVSAIATQMHWNTDLAHMNSSINVLGTSNTSVAQLFRWAIDNFAKEYDDVDDYLNLRVSILGCPQLSFRIGDFFTKKGDDISPKEDVSVLAWMIKEGKIKTDTGENVFTGSFVFANGVQVDGGTVETGTKALAEAAEGDSSAQVINITTPKSKPVSKPAGKKNKPENKNIITSKFELTDESIYNEMVSGWRPGLEERRKREGWFVAKTEEEREQVRESINQTKGAKDNGGISDRIMIRSPKDKISKDKAVAEVTKLIKSFLDKYNATYPENAVNIDNVAINDLTKDLIKDQWAIKQGYILLDLYKNGTGKVQVRRDADFANWRNPVTGVFSKTIGGSGTLNFDAAKKWLANTLGIDENNVVLTKAIMRSATDEDVFGLTNVVLDRIAGEVTGYMKFSEHADAGVEYHEAWHYVNLLMHDKKTRNRIYESYIETHKVFLKDGVKIKDVEEAMADDFKVFMEGFLDKSISGKVRRLFNNILDFLIASRRKSDYRRAFKQIAKGKYASVKLDRESVSEFLNRYRQGVASVSHSVSGLSKEELDKMTHIDSYQEIFDGTNAVIRRVFSVLNLNSTKKMQAVANEGFNKVLLIVDEMIEEQSDENKVAKLQDIRDNEGFLRKALIDSFMELGILAKVKKSSDVTVTERNEINEDALKKEDNPENTWDKFTLTSQRKENSSLSTKLFLRQIPMYRKQDMEDGTVQYVAERDEYGTIKTYDPDGAWRTIIDTLWACDSYAELDEDGSYSPTSIMGIVSTYRNINPFFYALFEKLNDLNLSGEYGDIQLKSQIFSTVNSSKSQVLVIKIQNPKDYSNTNIEEEFLLSEEEVDSIDDNGVVEDRRRQWIIQNDSLVSVAKNTPRKWSKNLASNGLLGFDKKEAKSVVDKNFAKNIEKELGSIQSTIAKYKSSKKKGFVPKSAKEILNALDKLKPQIVNFHNKLGIESDLPSLNVYIALMSGIEGELTPQLQMDTLSKIFETSAIGSIPYVVEGIVENIGNSEVTHSGSKYERAIDEAFNSYDADSRIGVLAVAWSAVHPSSQEFSVKDANGNRLYPINLNSYISDRVRAMNNRRSGYIEKMQRSSYCQHSIIANAAKGVKVSDPKSKIKLNTFVGIRDADNAVGADYFGITAAEDYISKLLLTEDDQLIFPTMADKKTWNSLSSSNILLSHDTMVISPLQRDINKYIRQEYKKIEPYDKNKYTSEYAWELAASKWFNGLLDKDETRVKIMQSAAFDLGAKRSSGIGFDIDVENGHVEPRFQDTTLNRFAGYFLDELNTLIDYYNKDTIKHLVSDPNSRIENYHGKVKDGRMDFSGNGGKFRYLYGIKLPEEPDNLNHTLQGLFELQKKIEAGDTLDRSKQEGHVAPYIGIDVLGKDNLDGFELIREYLNNLKKTYFKRGGMAKPELLDAINNYLVGLTEQELFKISQPGSPLKLVDFDAKTGRYIPTGIPEQLLDRYTKVLQEANYGSFGKAYDSKNLLHHALFSLIGSHVANVATSIIEVEKIFSGDPAFYKKKTYKDDDRKTSKMTINKTFANGQVAAEEVEVENLDDVFSDKIKRLGGLLSPGQEMRDDFNEDELAFDPTLNCKKYTNLNIEDIEVPSLFLDEIEDTFRRQLVVDMIRSNTPEGFASFLTLLQNERQKTNERLKKEGKKLREEITAERAIDKIYHDDSAFKQMLDLLTDAERDNIELMLAQQMKPYKNITVSDAQVFIRPDLYRKIRIKLGEWSFDPDETGYSDEEAYNILEGITVNEDGTRTRTENPNDDWRKDPKLYEKVKKLQLFPLKMSYFQNDTELITKDISINRPIYNKMAIFPLFTFLRSTSVGKALYDRMNMLGNELDMISFKSAVKVGAVQKGADPIDKKESTEDILKKLNDQLKFESDKHLDYNTGTVVSGAKEGQTLAVTVQDLSNLRLQLNTHAHDAEIRAIGTQMFKIAFSNILDDVDYGTGKAGRKSRKGWQIKKDIIACINALTEIGVADIRERFYKDGHIDNNEVEQFVKTVVRNNGLGSAAEEIIANGGVAASLVSRTVFENSASSVVNSDVVDINTKGGTAIQQSIFGFVGYGNESIGTLSYNNGKELKWSASEGSLQVMLSMNFFKPVIPDYNNKTDDLRRTWLIEHNIIGEKAKPFGVGYRIPTQGMSSMFAFQVADVLPEQVGDLIIVPREFTAQTGSDFDVDKLYLATMSYKDGVLESLNDDAFDAFKNRKRSFKEGLGVAKDKQLDNDVTTEGTDVTKQIQDASDTTDEDIRGAIANRLLLNYIDIISDIRNYADARGSIDVITNTLHDKLIDNVLKERNVGYIQGMTELLPSFLALRKMEFGVGKDGIGPFALNITNLALTQYTHITIDFGKVGEEYGFGPLDQIYGKDGQRISAWLSAMVNAHVDVAKDPYVFDLNVNKATYNHANMLLRCGMGLSTFTFLAQPILKEYTSTINNAGGLYGDNLEGNTPMAEENRSRKKSIYRKTMLAYEKKLSDLLGLYQESMSEESIALAKETSKYVKYLFMNQKDRNDNGYTGKNIPKRPIQRMFMFNERIGIDSILSYRNYTNYEINSKTVDGIVKSLVYLLSALLSFIELEQFSLKMSELVTCSQIDTKKFGNTIHQQIDFKNKYYKFRHESECFTINTPEFKNSLKENASSKEISKAALDKYFNELYLDKKLRAATRYTREIMSRQLFSATDTYESIFRNLFGIINGYIYFKDNSIPVGYEPVYNLESVDAFANGIDNLMRFNSFIALGPSIYTNAMTKHGTTQMIDFTLGGNKDAIIAKFRELVLGNKDKQSIFVRVASFINSLKKDPYSEKADGLVDAEGNIINDMLLYLNPQTPNDKYPIGRMLLQQSQTENKSSEERRLISAFAQLLDHQNEEVRELARDIAFYAYFSAYDQNTANSFFHLVPFEYRKQYDTALKNSLAMLASKKPEIKATAILNVGGVVNGTEEQVASNMLDVLSRNYWYNDDIVPVHYITKYPSKKMFLSGFEDSGEFTGASMYDEESGRTFPTYIASTKVRNDSIYIKIRKGSGTFLYKKVGTVERTYTNKEGKEKKASQYSIYVAIPKAGIHKNGINQFELYADYTTPSIFALNKLEKEYAEDVVRKEIEELIDELKDGYYKLKLDWNNETVNPMYVSSNTDTYIGTQTVVQDKRKIAGITVYGKKSPEYTGQKTATVILDVVNTSTSGEVERPNILNDYKDKVVEFAMDKDISDIVKAIRKISEKDIKIHITTSMYDGKFDVSDEAVENYIKEELAKYSAQLGPDVLDREALLKAKEESLRMDKFAARNASQQILNNKLHDLTQLLILSGATIARYSTAAQEGKTQLALSVAYVKHVDGTYLNSDKNTVFVDKKLIEKKKKFMSLLSQLDYTPTSQILQEETATVTIPEKELETSETKVELIVKKELSSKPGRSRFAKAASEEMEDVGSDTNEEKDAEDVPAILKEAAEKEQNKEEGKNQQCGASGRRGRFRAAEESADEII